jgi:hypothetical protein
MTHCPHCTPKLWLLGCLTDPWLVALAAAVARSSQTLGWLDGSLAELLFFVILQPVAVFCSRIKAL